MYDLDNTQEMQEMQTPNLVNLFLPIQATQFVKLGYKTSAIRLKGLEQCFYILSIFWYCVEKTLFLNQ